MQSKTIAAARRPSGRFCLALIGAVVATWLAAAAPLGAKPLLAAYGELPAVSDMTLSPNGERFAFVSVSAGQTRVFIRTTSGHLLQAVAVSEQKVRSLEWAGNDHLLVFTSRAQHEATFSYGNMTFETLGVAVVNAANGQKSVPFKKSPVSPDFINGYYGSRIVSGHTYGFFRSYNLEDNYRPALFRVDLDSNEIKIMPDVYSIDNWVVGDDGRIIAHSEFISNLNTWRLIVGESSGRTLFQTVTPEADVHVLGPGRTSGSVLVKDDTGTASRIMEIDTSASASPTALFTDLISPSVLRSPTTGHVVGAVDTLHRKSEFLDPVWQARFDAAEKPFSKYRVQLASFDENFDRIILLTDGADDAGTYWMVDLKSGAATELAERYPTIRPSDVGPTSMVDYAAADGLKMQGVLTLPPDRKPANLPLILLPHGGPFDMKDEVGFDWWAQAFASQGYAVFQPNYRGSGGSGMAFVRAGYGEWGGKMQTDLSDGVAHLGKEGMIDPKRVCIVGGSYGGYAALAGVTVQHGLYRCAVSYGGVSDIGGILASVGGNLVHSIAGRDERRALGATWSGDPILRARSPADHASEADAPILLIHGRNDTVVLLQQSQRMASLLQQAGKPVTFVQLEGEDHWLSSAATRKAMLTEAVQFVEKNNPP